MMTQRTLSTAYCVKSLSTSLVKTKELVLKTRGARIALIMKEIASDDPCYASPKTSQHPGGISSIKKALLLRVLRTSGAPPLFREAELASISQWRLKDSVAS